MTIVLNSTTKAGTKARTVVHMSMIPFVSTAGKQVVFGNCFTATFANMETAQKVYNATQKRALEEVEFNAEDVSCITC